MSSTSITCRGRSIWDATIYESMLSGSKPRGSRAELAGDIRDFDAPQLALELKATIDAARSSTLLGMRDPLAGAVVVAANANGPLAGLAIGVRVSASALQFRSLSTGQVDARATYDGATRRVDVSSAIIKAPWGRLSGSGILALGQGRRSRLQAELTGVDTAAVMRGLNLPYVADSRANGKLDAEWPGLEYLKASAAGTVTLAPGHATIARRTIPVGGRLSMRSNAGKVVADLQQIAAAGAQVGGHVEIDDGRLQGQLHASVLDLQPTSAAVETFLGQPKGSLLPVAVKGAANIDARLSGTVNQPTGHVNVSAPSLSVEERNDVAIDGELTFTPAEISVTRGDARWEGAHAGITGTVGLSGNRKVDLVIDADAANLQPLVRGISGRESPLSGSLSAGGTIRGTTGRPLASFTVHGADITAFGESFGSLEADVALTGREVTLSRLLIDKPQPESRGQISATGSYNLERKSYTLDLQSDNVRLLTLRLPTGQQIRGKVQLTANGAGSVSSPAGTMNLVIDSLEVGGLGDASTPRASQLGQVTITASAANHQATITASAPDFNLDGNATVGLTRPWPTTVSLRANNLDLERLPLGLRSSLAGQLRATMTATGSLSEPAHGVATATIETLAGSWNGQPFGLTAPGELGYANKRLDIKQLHMTAPDSSLTLTGTLPVEPDAKPVTSLSKHTPISQRWRDFCQSP